MKSKFGKLLLLIIVMGCMMCLYPCAVDNIFDVDALGAILMEASTGKIMYEKDADKALPPASVTKVMTLLLIMEAIDNGNIKFTDMVSTSERAASMGGSQIFLKVGETMSVDDMVKSIVVSSANDAAVALAEFICGSEEAFITRMNERAKELGMNNTTFLNTNGLDDGINGHLTSARDIAIMSRELIKHPKILEYSSIWMDTIRDGAFGLTNTNRLIRFYRGANGLKTGSTSKAKFCISATAKRDNMQLIAVIMGSPTRDIRNDVAKKLLDFGFANYTLVKYDAGKLENVKVLGGVESDCGVVYGEFQTVLEKGKNKNVEQKINIEDTVSAPIVIGQKLGTITFLCNEEEIGKIDIKSSESIEKINFFGLFSKMLKKFLLI